MPIAIISASLLLSIYRHPKILHDAMSNFANRSVIPTVAFRPRPADGQSFQPGLSQLVLTLARWIERHRTRQALAELDGRRLRDIGLTADQAREESNKPFWR